MPITDRASKRSQQGSSAGSYGSPPGFFIICFSLLTIFSGGALRAHDPGLSSVDLRLEGSVLKGRLTLARADLGALAAGTAAPIDLHRVGLEALSIRSEGRSAPLEVGPVSEGSDSVT